ncbi:hypothetical protein J007_01444 [Cryptococcus neoformans]|nr:hypothetical protein J007_01444 [Cryptococcus neoformans var. grubii]
MASQKVQFASSNVSRTKALQTRPILNDSELGIGIWQKMAVFLDDRPVTPSRQLPGGPQTPISISSQSSGPPTPISVSSSSPSPVMDRPRAVPRFNSSIARTAFTPPRASPGRKTPSTENSKPIHPFFLNNRRTNIPTPIKPPRVANYTSTEAESSSSQQTSASQSTSESVPSSQRNQPDEEKDIIKLMQSVEKMRVALPPKTQSLGPSTSTFFVRRPLVKAQSVSEGQSAFGRLPVNGSRSSLVDESTVIPLVPENHAPGAPPAYVFKFPDNPDPSLPLFDYRTYLRPPMVVYTRSMSEAEDLVACLKGPILGFDLEWPTSYNKIWDASTGKYGFQQYPTALVQLCDEKMIVLIHLQDKMDLPAKVAELVRDPKVYKLGVQSMGDGRKLVRDFPHHFRQGGPAGLYELSQMAHAIDPQNAGHGSRLIKLATLCRAYLGKELDKDTKIRRGDWAGELDEVQKTYAANDVFVSIQIFNALRKLAEERNVPLDLDSWSSSVIGRPERTASLTTSGMMAAATGTEVSVNRVLKPAVTMPGGLPSHAMEPGKINSSSQGQTSRSQAQPLVPSQKVTTTSHAQHQSQAGPDVQAVAQSQNQPRPQQLTTQPQSMCLPPNVGRHVQITGPGFSNKKSTSVKQPVTVPLTQQSPPALSQLPYTAHAPAQTPAQNQPLPQAQPSDHIVYSNIRPCANTTGNAHPFLYGADEEDDEFESYDSTYGLLSISTDCTSRLLQGLLMLPEKGRGR